MAKASASKRAESQPLPTMEDMGIPEIQEAGAALVFAVSERVAKTKLETKANQRVVEIMQKHERDFYSHDGLVVEIKKGKTKASAKYEGSDDTDTE